RLHVADLEHVDELVKLLRHLVDRVDGAVDGERDPRDVRVVGGAHGEGVDVEAAAAEQAGDARQHAGLVLDQEREHVLSAGQAGGDLKVLELYELRSPSLHYVTSLHCLPSAVCCLIPPCPSPRRPRGSSGSSSRSARRGRRGARAPRSPGPRASLPPAPTCPRSASRSTRRRRRASPSRGSGPSRPPCSGHPKRAPATGGPS